MTASPTAHPTPLAPEVPAPGAPAPVDDLTVTGSPFGTSASWVDGHLLDDLGDRDLTPRAWVNGALMSTTDATVSAMDRGLQSGIGCFTSLRVAGRHLPPTWTAHLDRLATGAAAVGITSPPADVITAAVQETVDADDRDDVAVRVALTAGPTGGASPTMVVSLQVPGGTEPDTAITVDHVRGLAGIKSTSYADVAVMTGRAQAAGATTALLVHDGWVLEAATSSVAMVRDGVLTTPTGRLLPSITMTEVCQLAADVGLEVRRERVAVADLMAADEVLLASAVRGPRGLIAVDGTTIGGGRPGPRTREIQHAWLDVHAP